MGPQAIATQLNAAIEHNVHGRLDEAERLCRAILDADPRQFTARHLLAVVLCRAGRLAEGEQELRTLLTLKPGAPEILSLVVDVLHAQGKLVESIEAARTLVAACPADATAWQRLGVSLQDGGELSEAVEAHTQALDRCPGLPRGRFNLGIALHGLGRLEEAAAALMQAAEQEPDNADAYLALGNVLCDREMFDAALMAYDHALQQRPGWPEALTGAGLALTGLKQPEQAAALHKQAATLAPDHAPAWTNLGGALQTLGQFEAARAAFEQAVRLQPGNALALSNLGLAQEICEPDSALGTHRRAVAADPSVAIGHFNLGLCLLRHRHYPEGWREYEWRWCGGVARLRPRGFTQPQWQGEDLGGRTLLIHAEQGLGDTIQFVRFVRYAAARVGRVVLEVQPPLLSLLRDTPGADQVVATGAALPPFDLHVPLMSLPGVLDLPETAFGETVPYLAPDAADAARWRDRLGAAGPRVGLAWSGNPAHAADRQRSLPAGLMLSRLAPLPVRLCSLQKDVRDSDRLAMAVHAATLTDLGPDLTDFTATAAVLSQLDLLITVDTAIAHLAGALGCPTWLLLPFNGEWRWQSGREDTPWYPRTRLFRQETANDWAGVLDRVAAALTAPHS